MNIVCFSTNDVFEVESLLTDRGIDCKIVPTPVTDKAYCGVSVEVNIKDKRFIEEYIQNIEYSIIDKE